MTDVIVVFHLGQYFVVLPPFLTAQKIKISKKKKKEKKHLEISQFYTTVHKIMIICYTILEIWRVTNMIVVFYFGQFFVILLP